MRAPGTITNDEAEVLHKAFEILEAFGMSVSSGLMDLREIEYLPTDQEELRVVRLLRKAESSSAAACIAIEEVLEIAQA